MTFVLSPDSVLPCRCLKCNAEAAGSRLSRRICTLSAWYPLFSSAGWNAHCVDERTIHISFSLCPIHRLRWIARLALIGFAGLANVFCFVACRTLPHVNPIADFCALALPMLIFATVLTLRPIIRPRRVHHGLAWFAGAGSEFLNSLPDLQAPVPVETEVNAI